MPAPRWLARVNRRVTNRILAPVATHLPGFGVVVHTGRKTRRRYRTPVNVFVRADRYVIALTYGRDAQWVRNVLADGGCTLETRGRALGLTRPRLFHDADRHAVPATVRLALRLVNVSDFLELEPATDADTPAQAPPRRAGGHTADEPAAAPPERT
jgi:deazaflavin-dependent oxidoreductase (nitroreductase family)